jgi:hypothetical protein
MAEAGELLMADTVLTAGERGDLADRMLPVAGRLACILHGEGDARDVAHALDPLDRIELVAVIVNLAAMVDPDAPLADLLGHVTWDEYGAAAEQPKYGRLTPRSLVPIKTITPSGVHQIFEAERHRNAVTLGRRGIEGIEIARRVGANEHTVGRWLRDAGVTQPKTTDTKDTNELRSA